MKKAPPCDHPDCVFCKAVCPECGSNNITVEFTPTYRFTNNILDEIHVELPRFPLVVTCDACGDRFTAGMEDDDNDRRVYDLGVALVKLLGCKPKIVRTVGKDYRVKPVGKFKKAQPRRSL